MTNQQHPITPPPELLLQWVEEHFGPMAAPTEAQQYIATQAARWGADQELEACCEWFQEFYKTESWVKHDLKHFREARRPKPPSLKEQALKAVSRFGGEMWCAEMEADLAVIHRALEQLDD